MISKMDTSQIPNPQVSAMTHCFGDVVSLLYDLSHPQNGGLGNDQKGTICFRATNY